MVMMMVVVGLGCSGIVAVVVVEEAVATSQKRD